MSRRSPTNDRRLETSTLLPQYCWSVYLNNRKWHLDMLIAALVIAVIVGFRLLRSEHPSPHAFAASTSLHAGRIGTLPNPGAPKSATTPAQQTTNANSLNTVDVCGIGKVTIDGPGAEKAEAEFNSRIAKDMLRWYSALLNSSDVRARAVGLFIDSKFDGNSARSTPLQQSLDSLVTLAEETKDPGVYAIALSACTDSKAPTLGGSCERISLQDWSKLEPDNAAPWLELAGKARTAKDGAAENGAFAQAARASQIQGYNWSLFGFAEADIPSDITPLERYQLSIQMIGIEAAMYSPQMPTISASKHCSTENVRNDAVRGQCSQLAELFVTKGTTVMDLIVGTSIGERTGWPEARVAALREEKEALQAAAMQAEPDPAIPESVFSCEAAARRNHYLHETAQLGEIAAALEATSLSGRTTSELAQSYRDYLNKLMHSTPPTQAN